MKRMFIAFGLLSCALTIAACGSGSAPSGPKESPSRYQAALNWAGTASGGLWGNTGFGITNMLVTIPFAGTQYSDGGLIANQTSFGVGLAPPSPLPTGVPINTPQPADLLQIRSNPVSWSASGVPLTITPDPQLDAMLGPTVIVAANGVPGTAVLTATAVGPPVNVGVSVKVFVYRVADVGCVDSGALGGAAFVPDARGGHFVAKSDAASSDLYVTGPQCAGPFADSSGYTVHVPYGGELINTSGSTLTDKNTFFTMSPQTWQNSFTELSEAQFETTYLPCSQSSDPRMCFTPPNNVLVFKTSTGDVVKMYIATTYHATTSGRNITGAFEVSSGGGFPF